MAKTDDAQSWAGLLAQTEPFAGLSRVALAKLAGSFEPLAFPAGAEVFHQDDASDGLYVVTVGRFGVFAGLTPASPETSLGTLGVGELFGEMSLLSGETRSATIRALEDGSAVRLDPARFDELLRREPSVSQSIAAGLVRRVRHMNRVVIERDLSDRDVLGKHLASLSPERRARVLQASALGMEISPEVLAAVFDDRADEALADLRPFLSDPALAPGLLRLLRDVFIGEGGPERVAASARDAARRLERHGLLVEALRIAADYGPRSLFLELLGDGLRQQPPPSAADVDPWVQTLTDEECVANPDLALALAEQYEQQGELAAAAKLVREAEAAAKERGDAAGLQRLGTKSSSFQVSTYMANVAETLAAETDARTPSKTRTGTWRMPRTAAIQAALAIGLLGAATIVRAHHQWAFALVLAAALIMWSGEVLPNYAVALALVAAWMLLGLADAGHALSGFASLNWLFVFALLALADGVARSGLLFRLGLLLTRHMPRSLIGQATVLMAAGALMAPLLPQNQARAAMTAPLALAVVDGQRLPDRGPAAAVLGLATWIGSGPLMFVFLNGSPLCLLAWGLLPDADRAQFDWVGWLLAALPFGLMVFVASLIMLVVVFRPPNLIHGSPDRLDVQMAILGRLSDRERNMIWVMGLTVVGFIAGPAVGVDIRIVAPITLVLAVLLGASDKRSLQELDWGYLLFLGVVLTIPDVLAGVGLDTVISGAILHVLDLVGGGPIVLLLAVAAITVVARLVMDQYQGIVLFCTTLMPAAAALGVHPWLVAVIVLATSAMWFVPNQTNSYLVTYAGSEGRLFSHGQARAVCVWYLAVVLGCIVLSVPYWQYLGLL